MATKIGQIVRSKWLLAVGCVLLGALVVLGIRVAVYRPAKEVHYHANFAVYINGQREAFKAFNYYEEEVASTCSVSEAAKTETTPMSRVHMHANVNDVVHVEDGRVTWGNFFTVLGWNVGPAYLATRNSVYQNGPQGQVTYLLNGKTVADIANVAISDQDKLLVSYGDQTTAQISQEYKQIKNNALRADQSKDPASCGAGHDDSASFGARVRHMF
jgi:hypothetical protein